MGSVVWPGWERFLWLLSTRLTDGLQHGLGDLGRATATIAPDGSQVVVYVPTPRTITIDTSALTKGMQAVGGPVNGALASCRCPSELPDAGGER